MREVGGVLMVEIEETTTPNEAWKLFVDELTKRGFDGVTIAAQRQYMTRAWWGDDERGFVQAHHDRAQVVATLPVPVKPEW